MRKDTKSYDVAVIGAGPVGCVAALAYAQKGADVLMLEANPKACGRLAGEWLHPRAVEILKQVGVELGPADAYPTGQGFVVYPDDGTKPIALPYDSSSLGYSLHHERLVDLLRAKASANPNIEYVEPAKATRIVGQNLTYQLKSGAMRTIYANQLVGAAGRASVAHAALGVAGSSGTYSRMAGILLEDTELPFEGYGHVVLGALGPILIYRISPRHVRVCIDVPLSVRITRDKEAVLHETYVHAMPESLRIPFRKALLRGDIAWATNQTRARTMFGRPGLALVGDAVGHHHPLTALGMTLGFQDAISLTEAASFNAYRRERSLDSRVPEMLAVALYEVFADTHDEVIETRKAIYELWRTSATERCRTMRYLAGQETRPSRFASSFLKAMMIASRKLVSYGLDSSHWHHVRTITEELGSRTRWLLTGALHLTEARPSKELPRNGEDRYAGALKASAAKADVVELPSVAGHAARTGLDRWDPGLALSRGVRALEALQDVDGSFEGEVVWCPLLAAQYVLAWHVMDRPVDPRRLRRLLQHFERTRTSDGVWGLSEGSEPNMFVTATVYVASRLLGVAADAPLLAGARAFFEREGGVVAIPSWGKLWLSVLGLYRWEGVSPVLPEVWSMPKDLPIHPSHYYCHTRLIYMAMAVLYGERFQAPITPVIEELRRELFPLGFERVDFEAARRTLRKEDLYTEPSAALSLGFEAARLIDRAQTDGGRRRVLEKLRENIRWELRNTAHSSISPVSGLLDMLALYAADPNDADLAQAVEHFEGWMWEDDREGTRVAGARSAVWDTSFAMQALAAAAPHADVTDTLARADAFLDAQQIRVSPEGFEQHHRVDPKGGFPFSRGFHGWPVSDCTAEALLARLASGREVEGLLRMSDDDVAQAVSFMLRTQSKSGGFASYEPERSKVPLEWLNPAEMFGDAMTEHAHVECTASCLVALTAIARQRPRVLRRPELASVPQAIERATKHLRNTQRPEGSWAGAWGVHLIYGTMFGIRGLLAGGVPPTDPSIRRATAWLKAHQRPDGSWGERHHAHATSYVEHQEGQVVQTAWALFALLEAKEPDWDALERAARFIARSQLGSGEWPRQAPLGVFFHTALLEYSMYRSYFPVLALAAFESRHKERNDLIDEVRRANVAAE